MTYSSLKSAGVFMTGPGQFNVRPALHLGTTGDRLAMAALRADAPVPNSEVVTISGCACPFEKVSGADYGTQVLFRRGAFTKSLQLRPDLPVLADFNSGKLFGRTRSGTAAIYEDDQGLQFEVLPPPGVVWSDDWLVSLSRHDITGAAVACIPRESYVETRGKDKVVIIRQADVVAVSICSFPQFDCGLALTRSSAGTGTSRADRAFLSSMGILAGGV